MINLTHPTAPNRMRWLGKRCGAEQQETVMPRHHVQHLRYFTRNNARRLMSDSIAISYEIISLFYEPFKEPHQTY